MQLYISSRIFYKGSDQKNLSITSDMKLIIIGIFFVACLLTNFEVESSAQNRDNVVGLLLRPTSKSSPIRRSSRPQLSGIERFYGTRGTRGCPRRKISTYQNSDRRNQMGLELLQNYSAIICSSPKLQTRKLKMGVVASCQKLGIILVIN